MIEILFTYLLMYALDVKAYGLVIGLLSMCEVMGFHIYIKLVGLE